MGSSHSGSSYAAKKQASRKQAEEITALVNYILKKKSQKKEQKARRDF